MKNSHNGILHIKMNEWATTKYNNMDGPPSMLDEKSLTPTYTLLIH